MIKILECNPTFVELTTETLNAAKNAAELKAIMKWLHRESNENVPTEKDDIIKIILGARHREAQDASACLLSKIFDDDNSMNLDRFPSCDMLIAVVIQKYERDQADLIEKEME